MKKYFSVFLLFAALAACQSKVASTTEAESTVAASTDAASAPKVEVEKAVYEFGSIVQGQKVQYDFKFKNTGKSPLIISNATATCGCTIPEYPTEPIKPGESGIIKVIFNSEGKMGLQDKIVTITSNANPKFEELHLVGDVIAKK